MKKRSAIKAGEIGEISVISTLPKGEGGSHVNGPGIRLKWIAAYHGPNPEAGAPVVVAELRADSFVDAVQVERFSAALWVQSGMDPSSYEVSSDGPAGDALLAFGTAASSWALAALNEVRGYVAHAGAARIGDVVRLWIGFHRPEISRAVLHFALRTLFQLMRGQVHQQALKVDLERLWQACRRYHPDYQARILMVGAREMDVPCLPFLPDSKYWQFGWGGKARVFLESSSNADGMLGWQWQKSKATAKALMISLGLPTPIHVLVGREEELVDAVNRVAFPCVVKPLDSGGGKGVTANIRSLADAQSAFYLARRQTGGQVIVEAHVQGDDHRLMVINGQMVAAIRREASAVMGDGHKSVSALVADLNAQRTRNMVRSRYQRPIAIDDVLEMHLATQSLKLTDIPAKGQRVALRSNANLSTGGTCTDVTAICHPQVRAMAEQLAKTSGLTTIGIDYLTTDIANTPSQTGGAFIEMNTTPGLDACVAAGWSEASIARMVLGASVARIPVDLTVLSTAGLDTLSSIVGRARVAAGHALVIGERLLIGDLMLRVAAAEPWATVKASLRNHDVKQVHVLCSADDVVRLGLPVDRVDRARISIHGGDVVLPEEWVNVLRQYSRNGIFFDPEREILKRLQVEIVRPEYV